MKRRILALALLVLLILVSGCVAQSAEEAQVEFCQALVAYGDSVQALKSVNASTTVDELQAARDSVTEARETVRAAAGNLREAQLRDAEKAWANAQDAINAIPGDATLGEAAATIRGQAVLLSTEIEQVRNISCRRR